MKLSTLKVLIELLKNTEDSQSESHAPDIAGDMMQGYVIIRTFSAGVWAGTLEKKSGSEVVLRHASRLWQWHAAESISLSAVAKFGIKPEKSKIAPSVESVWLEAIEIIPCTPEAKNSIRYANAAVAT